jgi:hypothetical protein
MTASRTYRFTATTLDGHPLCTVLITRERTEAATAVSPPAPVATAPARPDAPVNGRAEESRMTEPQKRYLFRLLAQQGLDAKAAEGHLLQAFRVASFRDVSLPAASQLIEQLLTTQKEAGHAHA